MSCDKSEPINFPIHHMLLSRKGLRWKEGHIVPFTVYIDDSGTSPSQRVAIAAALIIPAKRILGLERELENLKKKEGFSDFHASECAASNPRSVFRDWDDPKKKRVFNRMRQLTKKYVVQIVCFAVKKNDYETCVPDELRQYAGKYHYSWAMRHVASIAQIWRSDRTIQEPYEWLFDSMKEDDPARLEIENVMEQAEEEASKHRGVEHEYEYFDFRPRASRAGLQCADLVAWTNYNMALEKYFNTPPNPFALAAWKDFDSMPVGSSPGIHMKLEWNFAIAIKPDKLADWAKKEIVDGRSLARFREWELKKKAIKAGAGKRV